MPKGIFSIFKKDPLLICDLVILITVVYFIILLLLNNFEFVLRKQSNFRPNFYAVNSLVWPSLLKQQQDKDNVYG